MGRERRIWTGSDRVVVDAFLVVRDKKFGGKAEEVSVYKNNQG